MAVRSRSADVIYSDIENSLERAVRDLVDQLNTVARRDTPRRTGRAARGWRVGSPYILGRTQIVLENQVPYIGLLEMGYSRQAPDGIIEPALDTLTRRITRL